MVGKESHTENGVGCVRWYLTQEMGLFEDLHGGVVASKRSSFS